MLSSQANGTQTFCGIKNLRHLFRASHLGNNSTSLCLGQVCFLGQGACSGRDVGRQQPVWKLFADALGSGHKVLQWDTHSLLHAVPGPSSTSPLLPGKGGSQRGSLTSSKNVLVCSTISLKQKLMSLSVSSSRIFFRAFKLSQTTSVRAKWYRPLMIDSNMICLCFFTCQGTKVS